MKAGRVFGTLEARVVFFIVCRPSLAPLRGPVPITSSRYSRYHSLKVTFACTIDTKMDLNLAMGSRKKTLSHNNSSQTQLT